MVGFDIGPLLQGQRRIAKLKSAYNLFVINPRGLQCETNSHEILSRESSELELELTFGPSFKVKRWFTGFGEFSLRWIQIYIGSLMRRFSSTVDFSLKSFSCQFWSPS